MNKRYGRAVDEMSDFSTLADSDIADENASMPPRAEMVRRAKSLASWCLGRRKPNDEVNPQQDSPVFNQLPQEIRDRIWEFAFAPPRPAKSAHFHVYDEIYDACTYQPPNNGVAKDRAALRKRQANIALLMSCRRIYQEALRYLYDDATFTFVVLAGLPREHCKPKFDDRCKSLGKIQDCEQLFRRIRHLTLIIQPGKNPHAGLYAARVKELLSVLDHGKHLLSLNLIFNYRLEINDNDPDHTRRRQIIAAFYPLHQQLTPRIMAGKCQLSILGWTDDMTSSSDKKAPQLIHLLRALGGLPKDEEVLVRTRRLYPLRPDGSIPGTPDSQRNVKLITWDPMMPLDKNMCVRHGAEMCCLERGAFGDNNKALRHLQPTVRPPPANRRILPNVHKDDYLLGLYLAAGLTTFMVFSPVLAPLIAYGCVNRKKKKGEWK